MSTVRTSADLRLKADGTIEVAPFIRLDGNTDIYCLTYDHAPILLLASGKVRVSLSVPDVHHVTSEDVEHGHRFAEAVSQYVAELERRAAAGKDAAAEGRAA